MLTDEQKQNKTQSDEIREMKRQLQNLDNCFKNLEFRFNSLIIENESLESLLKQVTTQQKNPKINSLLSENAKKRVNQLKHPLLPSGAKLTNVWRLGETTSKNANTDGDTSEEDDDSSINKTIIQSELTQTQTTESNENASLTISGEVQVDETEETSEFNENEKRKRSNNIPPVGIWTKTQNSTQQIIRNQLPNFSCTFSIINKTKMRVFPKTSDIRSKLLSLLDERSIEYNTYTPLDQKMQNVLLKGTEIDSEHIIRETLEKNNIQPHNIQRFETGYMRKSNMKSNIWQIVLKPNTDLNLIFNIKYVAEWSVP